MAANPRYWTTVLWAGLAAGVGDTLLALVLFQVSPVRIFQSVAAGLLGRDSFQGGVATAALGMFLHFFIATTAAAVYVAASTRLKLLLKPARALWAGLRRCRLLLHEPRRRPAVAGRRPWILLLVAADGRARASRRGADRARRALSPTPPFLPPPPSLPPPLRAPLRPRAPSPPPPSPPSIPKKRP